MESVTLKKNELTKEGNVIALNGSHEFNVYKSISLDGSTVEDLKVFFLAFYFFNVCLKLFFKNIEIIYK